MSENTATVPSTENINKLVDNVDVKFRFRKVKDEATGLESTRPTVELSLPLLSLEGIAAIFEVGGKDLDLLLETVRDVQIARAKEIVSEKEDITQANFPFASISWTEIANMTKAERRGGGIPKETWEDFSKDYITVMPGFTGKTVEQVTNASKILLGRFNAVKTNKPVIKLLKDQIGIYISQAPNAEQFSDVLNFLVEKADTLLKAEEVDVLANLGG